MREYLEKQMMLMQHQIEQAVDHHKKLLRDVRQQAEKDLTEKFIDGLKWNGHYETSHHEAMWVAVAVKEVATNVQRINDLQTQYRVLLCVKDELDKYESPGTVTVGDAARQIIGNVKQSQRAERGCTLKKDVAIKAHFQGAIEAGCNALRALGYTDEQIEEMAK